MLFRSDKSAEVAGQVSQAEFVAEPPREEMASEDATDFDPEEFGNFSFDFGAAETEADSRSLDSEGMLASEPSLSAREDNAVKMPTPDDAVEAQAAGVAQDPNAFPVPTVSTADLLKFLIDRTGYIK